MMDGLCGVWSGEVWNPELDEAGWGSWGMKSRLSWAVVLIKKKGSEGQTVHLGRRHQAVHVELVHNADSHSAPCVAVGQQSGPILLTYRYWFLFLDLRLVSFWMPLILYKFCNCFVLNCGTDVLLYLRGAMGEISNFYNLSAWLLIFDTYIPPVITTHTSKFQSWLSDTFWIKIFSFLEKRPVFKIYLLGQI